MRGESVPCAAMVRHRGRPRGGLGEVLRARIRPCRFIHSAISEFLTAFLGLLADQRWPAGDAPARELLSVARWLTGRDAPGDDGEDDGDSTGFMKMAETVGAHGSQVRLRFLLGTGRLSESEVREMVDHLIFTLEDDFLPCKDDPQRDRPAVSIEEGPKVPAARFLCPLQVRGLRGDTTVPCSEALSLRPAESLLRRVREEYPQGALNRSRPPQAAYWRDDAERPGGPRDPVQEVGMRPCRDLGMVLGNGLAWLLRQSISRFYHDYSVFLAVSGGK